MDASWLLDFAFEQSDVAFYINIGWASTLGIE
jgi:hypothetical protein